MTYHTLITLEYARRWLDAAIEYTTRTEHILALGRHREARGERVKADSTPVDFAFRPDQPERDRSHWIDDMGSDMTPIPDTFLRTGSGWGFLVAEYPDEEPTTVYRGDKPSIRAWMEGDTSNSTGNWKSNADVDEPRRPKIWDTVEDWAKSRYYLSHHDREDIAQTALADAWQHQKPGVDPRKLLRMCLNQAMARHFQHERKAAGQHPDRDMDPEQQDQRDRDRDDDLIGGSIDPDTPFLESGHDKGLRHAELRLFLEETQEGDAEVAWLIASGWADTFREVAEYAGISRRQLYRVRERMAQRYPDRLEMTY